MVDLQLHGGHGGQGSEDKNFTRLLAKDTDYKPLRFAAEEDPDTIFGIIAEVMDQGTDPASDLPDDQENPYVPAAYTYLGQFIDHDLTFDNRSTLVTIGDPELSSLPSDERTPRFDLDCLYGLGPNSAPFMYDSDGRLAANPTRPYDLPRAATLYDSNDPLSNRAIIGDPRNDENSIVCQLQIAFIHFHNAMIDGFKQQGLTGSDLFTAARKEVRFTYQKMIVSDFLRRIVQKSVYDQFVQEYKALGANAYKLYKPGSMRNALPVEFTGAAYRYGHSGVRNAYRLNKDFRRLIFTGNNIATDSLVGFGELPEDHVIDWSLFVTNKLEPGAKGDNPSKKVDGSAVDANKSRLQYAYKLDTSLVNPLLALPPRIGGTGAFRSLAKRNLKRGYNFSLPSGQDIAKALGVTSGPPLRFGDRGSMFKDMPNMPAAAAAALEAKTPLWLYVLAEAQAMLAQADGTFKMKADENGDMVIDKDSNEGTQLGPVGGRIIMEVFFARLEDDEDSYLNASESWNSVVRPGSDIITLWDILHFIDKV